MATTRSRSKPASKATTPKPAAAKATGSKAAAPKPSASKASSSNGAAPTVPAAPEVPVVARPDRTQAQLLQGAAEEAARLLDADGAFLYLLDAESGIMRFAYSAGIADPAPDHWIRQLELPVGQGMFGKAVAERRIVVS